MDIMDREARCPLCASEQIHLAYSIPYMDVLNGLGEEEYDQKIYYCDVCGMVWTGNPMGEHSLEKYYKFMSKYESDEIVGASDFSLSQQIERQYEFINQNISDYYSVLEIGASTGENLSLYKNVGKRVFGIEPSARNKKWAYEKYGVELAAKTFNEWYASEEDHGSYDLIFMSHVLEHITDFAELVSKVGTVSPKYFFIEVPYLESMGIGAEPFGMFTFEHVNYFSKSSLESLMTANGYTLIAQQTPANGNGESPGYPTYVSLWEYAGGKNADKGLVGRNEMDTKSLLNIYYEASKRDFNRIERIVDQIDKSKKLAVWPAGEHTARLLGMTTLREKNIVKFYDSDIKKKGLTKLGRPIETFDKQDVISGVIEAILISSHASEQSIERFIRSQNVDVEVIKLYS